LALLASQNHLGHDAGHDIVKREAAFLVRHLAVIDGLEQQVAQLFAQMRA
jgi:hypothetical protein